MINQPKWTPEKWRALIKTGLFYLIFIAMGMVVSVPGPTLLNLQHIVKCTTEEMSLIFTFRSLGNIIGVLLGGVIMDRFQYREYILIADALGMSITIACVPFCTVLWQVKMVIFLNGFSMGGLNNGVNVCCLKLWGKEVDRYFQALHFAFAVGGFLGPLVIAPFLEDTTVKHNTTATINTSNVTTTYIDESPELLHQFTGTIKWAYIIVCMISILVTFLFGTFMLTVEKNGVKNSTEDEPDDTIERRRSVDRSPGMAFTVVSVMLTAAASFFSTCIEAGYSQMIAAYSVKGNHHFSDQNASYLTSVYWAAFMASRFIIIFVSIKVRSKNIVIVNSAISVFSAIILSVLANKYVEALWIGTAMVGAGIGPLFPGTVAWTGSEIDITFKIGAAFFAAGSIPEMIMPAILGKFIDVNQSTLFYFDLCAAIFGALMYSALGTHFKYKTHKCWRK